jgi:hypothetical protein
MLKIFKIAADFSFKLWLKSFIETMSDHDTYELKSIRDVLPELTEEQYSQLDDVIKKELDNRKPKNWRDYLSYPKQANDDLYRSGNQKFIRILDTMQTLIPLPDIEDRFSAMSKWLEKGLEEGLLTEQEHSDARYATGPLM